MPRHPDAPPTTPTPTAEVESRPPAKGDLTVNKIIAGAGAAATSAVLGSYLGAAGTVAGAAIGSVASMVATTLYQRSLDRTRATVITRIRLTNGAGRLFDPEVTIPMQRDAELDTVVVRPVPPPPRRRLRKAVVATVVVFVLALLAVTGLEWAKGSTITRSENGTSVGRVIAPEPSNGEPSVPAESDEEPATERSTEEPTPSDSSEVPDTARSDPGSGPTGDPQTGDPQTGDAEPRSEQPDGT